MAKNDAARADNLFNLEKYNAAKSGEEIRIKVEVDNPDPSADDYELYFHFDGALAREHLPSYKQRQQNTLLVSKGDDPLIWYGKKCFANRVDGADEKQYGERGCRSWWLDPGNGPARDIFREAVAGLVGLINPRVSEGNG